MWTLTFETWDAAVAAWTGSAGPAAVFGRPTPAGTRSAPAVRR